MLHRLALGCLAHAGLLAQRLGRTDARADAAHDIGVENASSAAPRGFSAAICADEQGNVDRGRAGLLAGRVEAEIAALGLDLRFVPGQRRMQIGEIGLEVALSKRPGRMSDAPGGLAAIVMGKTLGLLREGPSPFLTVWSIVPAARGVCQARQTACAAGPQGRRRGDGAPSLTVNRLSPNVSAA